MKEEDEKLLLILYGVPRRGAPAASSIATAAAADRTRNFVDGKSLFDRFFHFLDHYGWLTLAAAFGTVAF